MQSITEAMAQREQGAYPVSIATSLALESAFGHHPDKPEENPPPVHRVRNIWFNVRTLVRNYLGAIPTIPRDAVRTDDLVMGLAAELTIIESVVAQKSNGFCSAVFYVCDYSRVSAKYSHAQLKIPTTPKQKAYRQLENETVSGLLKVPMGPSLRTFSFDLRSEKGVHPASFILTHFPIDLLSRYQFSNLELLESHTGNIKNAALWNSKLSGVKDLDKIPFNSFTLQLFGDGGTLFSPMPAHLREQVLELARLDGWTPLTTMDKIKWSLTHVRNDVVRTSLMGLL